MRFSATLTAAFAATAMACSFEQNPAMVDRFVKLRSAPLEGEPMYTLEFSDGTTRQVTEDEKWALKRVSTLTKQRRSCPQKTLANL